MMILLLIFLINLTPAGAFLQKGNALPDSKEVILDKALQVLEQKFSDEEYRFHLKARWIPGTLLQTDPQNIQSVMLDGPVEAYTRFKVNYVAGGRLKSRDIQLKVEALRKLPVSTRRMKAGEEIAPADIKWQWIEIIPGRDKPAEDPQQLIGKALRRNLNAGSLFPAPDLSEPLMVEAGDLVDLSFNEHSIQIKLACEARQSGSKGEEIAIYCKETRKKYVGEITRPGEVQWIRTR